ncbi:ABC transporter substrate-binding protein [Novosphingobium sp.]|uniref:ABC transporter substrate-binding protein n=1 Tax=Novosphingobium sp. TaxID=1874826 RepID=UPI0025E4DBF9|nr:ABC transporter substrate-binding protein [Novosphingobium sp.]
MRSVHLSAVGALLLAIPTAVYAQANDPAQAPIAALDQGLVGIMKAGKSAGMRGRSAAIAPVVDRVYDIPLMTRLAVGAQWTSFAPSDQAALVTALRRLTIAQYASNFDGYAGQSFAVDPRVDVRGTDRMVRTTLNDPKGESVAIAYRLRQSGGTWKIIDVFYKNSISQLATRRADFARIVASGGAKALVSHLNGLSAKVGG